jgi:choline kinase
MIAVILAAGSSYRMRPLTDHMPKSLLPVGGKPIFGQILDNIAVCGIKDVLIIVGYHEEMIRTFVAEQNHDLNVRYVANEIYASTSDSVSVFKTQGHTGDQEILLIDSDQWFYPQVIEKLRQAEEPDVIAINCRDQIDEEAVKVVLDGKSRILEMGKPVDIRKAAGEAVGVRKFSVKFMNQLYAVLERRIVREGILDQVFEYSVQEMLEHGVPLYAVDTSEWPSIEMDTPEDYERAKKLIAQYEATKS